MVSIFDNATSILDDGWREFMQRTGLLDLARKAIDSAVRASGSETTFMRDVCPSVINIFAFARYPFSNTKVVILGQDPYPNRTDACGLAFSVSDESQRIPPSLKMIFTTLIAQGLMRESSASHGNLERWCEQGVILANAALTTLAGGTRKHSDLWREFTSTLCRALSNERPGMIFILLGTDAQKIKGEINQDNGCVRLCWGHPSPLNTANRDPASPKHFSKCPCFERTNFILTSTHRDPIDWDPVARAAVVRAEPVAKSYELKTMGVDSKLLCPFDKAVVAFVDGAASHNGYEDATAAFAVVICHKYINYYISGMVPVGKHTNQRAELTALCKLLEYASSPEFAEESSADSKLIIVYDSAYAWGAVTLWFESWKQEGAKVMATKMNLDLIESGASAYKRVKHVREVEGIHIKSHQKSAPDDDIQAFYWYGNKVVDEMARKLVEDATHARDGAGTSASASRSRK